ncbi:hypothetical protein [Thiosulfatihalobacter marinus]|uniref:hypothetical protein n=1 Tax=Thiosulfatihalobacter marinus TaxID=2792481 RepID=UPI0018D94DAC|nr:hypothetical protein [Thiosulfatihalobacter marinus]
MDFKIPAETSAEIHIQDMLVEFLRAISAQDMQGRAGKIAYHYWKAIHSLVEMEHDQRDSLVCRVFERTLDAARGDRTGAGYGFDQKKELLILSAAKIYAERISEVAVQETRANSQFSERFHACKRALYDERKKHRGF